MRIFASIVGLLFVATAAQGQRVITPTFSSVAGTTTSSTKKTSVTVGQPAPGIASQGALALQAGFWFQWPAADLAIEKTHSGSFDAGGTGDYTLTVRNHGLRPTSGTVTVRDVLPDGLTATAISGMGWTCTLVNATCTRGDPLAPTAAYPPITLVVTIDSDAPALLDNTATVSGAQWKTGNDTAVDATVVRQATTTMLISSLNPATDGDVITLTATVESAAGTPTGTVTFYDGGSEIGSVVLDDAEAVVTPLLTAGHHTITAVYGGGANFLPDTSNAVEQLIEAVAPPASFSATATSTTSVTVSWSVVTNATDYELYRKAPGEDFALVAEIPSTVVLDNGLASNTTFLYKVRAIGPSAPSVFTPVDPATTVTFTDPVLAGAVVKAVHATQLRSAVNLFRATAGLDPFVYSRTIAPGLPILAADVAELRTALDEARVAVGLPPLYAGPTLPPGAVVRAVHVTDIRDAVK